VSQRQKNKNKEEQVRKKGKRGTKNLKEKVLSIQQKRMRIRKKKLGKD